MRSLRERLLEGHVIPACPLPHDPDRRWSERHQRALARYYVEAGAGGLAVGVHSTQFEIRDPAHGLFEPVLDEVELMMKMGAAFQKQLEDRVAALKEEYPKITGKLVTGNTFLEIIQAARDDEVDMIVMGTHGRTGLAHVLIGSVAEKVVREAPCPVLTVKHPKHEFVKP